MSRVKDVLKPLWSSEVAGSRTIDIDADGRLCIHLRSVYESEIGRLPW